MYAFQDVQNEAEFLSQIGDEIGHGGVYFLRKSMIFLNSSRLCVKPP